MQSYALDVSWPTVLKDLDVAPVRVLRRAGLPDDLFSVSNVRLPAHDYHRLWEALETETGDPAFPITLCQEFRTEAFSPLLFAALCSPNLLAAAHRVAAFKELVGPMRLLVIEADEFVELRMEWDHTAPPPDSLVLAELLFCASLARMGTRERISPVQVQTPARPAIVEPYEDFLGARIRSGTAHVIRFSRADATRPFLTTSQDVWAALEPQLSRKLAELQSAATTADRVRAVLLEALPSGQYSMELVARRLGLSGRTLQRRLDSEATTFRDVLAETRTELAMHYLTNSSLPVSQIAFLLGFAEPTSFYRAFKNWTGETPVNMTPERLNR